MNFDTSTPFALVEQEASVSRYTITVTVTPTGDHHADPDAVIGYDPPLRTFFLQAFPDETGDGLADFVNNTLFPKLKALPGSEPRAALIRAAASAPRSPD